jgi:hypothetical protein
MEPGNTRTVFVVQVDNSKDLSDAKRYGQLRAVFGNPRKPYETDRMVRAARRVLRDYQPGDYLLMIGDPALCAVCAALVAEVSPVVQLLSWDRNLFRYLPQRWDLDYAAFADDEPADDFPMADD